MTPRYKHQTQRVNLAAGFSGDSTVRFNLDNSYKKCIGYVAYENVANGNNYQIGIKDDTYTYQFLTNKQDFIVTTAVPKSDRYTKCDIVAANNAITITIRAIGTLAAATDVDLVFLLEK